MPTVAPTHPVVAALNHLLPSGSVISDPAQLAAYECDGFTIARNKPLAVVFPTSTEQVSQVVQLLRRAGVAAIPRGAATGLAGGITAIVPSVQISTARMTKVHRVDIRNRWALVDAGVANLALSELPEVKASPYHFAPDPSSQRASTIGGNVATNAGGLHTLKYGVTVNHVLGIEVVLADGSVHTIGGPTGHALGPDLVGLISGTEGTLAIITKVWCRLSPKPKAFRTALAVYDDSARACDTVAKIIAAGIIPAALEMMDGTFVKIVEDAFHYGFPTDAQALLLLEIDGIELGLDEQMSAIRQIATACGARSFEDGKDPQRRADLWSSRKKAFGALGRLGFAYCTQDACVPRSKLPEVMTEIARIGAAHQLLVTNCFHAGDGNVHPVLCFDERDEAQIRRALEASGEILRYCIAIGGAVTGEHGVGVEKIPYMRDMFSPTDLAAMHRIRRAFVDDDTLNPWKVLPREGPDIDLLHPARHVPQ